MTSIRFLGFTIGACVLSAFGKPADRPIGVMRVDSVEYLAVRTPAGGIAMSLMRGGHHEGWTEFAPVQNATIDHAPTIQAPVNGQSNVFGFGKRLGNGFLTQYIVDMKSGSALTRISTGVSLATTESYSSSLAAGSISSGVMGVWGMAPDSQLVGKSWNPDAGSWTAMSTSNLRTVHAPWVTQIAPTTLNLYATGIDSTVMQNYYGGSTWSGWLVIPQLKSGISGPTSSFLGNGRHALFLQHRDSTIQSLVWNGSSWGNLRFSSFKVLSGPSALSAWSSEVALYALALDSQIVRIRWTELDGFISADTLGPIPGSAAALSVQRRQTTPPAFAREGGLELPDVMLDRSGRLEVMDAHGRTLCSAVKIAGSSVVALDVPRHGAYWYRLDGFRGRILSLR